jgi:hypothetical protein
LGYAKFASVVKVCADEMIAVAAQNRKTAYPLLHLPSLRAVLHFDLRLSPKADIPALAGTQLRFSAPISSPLKKKIRKVTSYEGSKDN